MLDATGRTVGECEELGLSKFIAEQNITQNHFAHYWPQTQERGPKIWRTNLGFDPMSGRALWRKADRGTLCENWGDAGGEARVAPAMPDCVARVLSGIR